MSRILQLHKLRFHVVEVLLVPRSVQSNSLVLTIQCGEKTTTEFTNFIFKLDK